MACQSSFVTIPQTNPLVIPDPRAEDARLAFAESGQDGPGIPAKVLHRARCSSLRFVHECAQTAQNQRGPSSCSINRVSPHFGQAIKTSARSAVRRQVVAGDHHAHWHGLARGLFLC